MVDNLDRIIKNVEDRWLVKLSKVCEKQFQDRHLPSHNEDHHLRVWNYTKLLLLNLPKNVSIHEEDLLRLIIAVFFHDQGMSITPSKEHGIISRKLCKTFFEEEHLTPPPHFDLVLKAIEQHDQKDYNNFNEPENFDILKILNIADDLDAFGVIGAYRYSEIYLMRKISINDIPELVANNLRTRFTHFSQSFQHNKQLIRSQTQRYITARNFFKDLELQIKLIGVDASHQLGPIGIINYIQQVIIQKESPLRLAITEALKAESDFYFAQFFEKLSKEC
jgi:HD superfamily phosphodiesterase